MNAMIEYFNLAGDSFIKFALPMLIQSSIFISILFIVDFFIKNKVRAVFRYSIWMLVLIKLLIPPSLSSPVSLTYLFPQEVVNYDISKIIYPQAVEPETITGMIEIAVSQGPGKNLDTLGGEIKADVIEARPHNIIIPELPAKSQNITSHAVIFAVWLGVVIAMVLLLIQRALFVAGLVRQSKNVNGRMTEILGYCQKLLNMKSAIKLKVSPNATSPAVCGLFRPVILVPENLAPSLGASHLRAVLLHELAHIKRGDLWINLIQTLFQIVYFYNPLVWFANAIIRRVREQAVDETVQVTLGENAWLYPETLVNVAKIAFKRPALSLRLIGVVESKSTLQARIKRMLNRPVPKSAKLGFWGLAALILFAAVLLPMAMAADVGSPGLVIKGVVTDAGTGQPIGGAKVFDDGYGPGPDWANIVAGKRSEWGAITNSKGEYSFLTWHEHHSFKVEADGYKSDDGTLYSGHLTLNKNDEEVFNFKLRPNVKTSGQALENTDEIIKAAENFFSRIQKANYKRILKYYKKGKWKRDGWKKLMPDYLYLTRTNFPGWVRWICENFNENPIISVELGEVFVSDKEISGLNRKTWPTLPYKLTLKDGSILQGDLPFRHITVKGKGYWEAMLGVDWHLQENPIKKPDAVIIDATSYSQKAVEKVTDLKPTAFRKKLNNGAMVELVGVCEFEQGKVQNCWKPDGTNLDESIYIRYGHSYPHKTFGFVFNTDKSSEITEFDAIGRRDWLGTAFVVDANNQLTELVRNSQQHVKLIRIDDLDSTDIKLFVTSPWKKRVKYDGRHVIDWIDPKINVIESYETTEDIKIIFQNNYKGYEVRIQAILNDEAAERLWRGVQLRKRGKFRIDARLSRVYSNGQRHDAAIFEKLKKTDVKYFEFFTRPRPEKVTFKNVSLKPKDKTDVAIIDATSYPQKADEQVNGSYRIRHFVRLVVGEDEITFRGKKTNLGQLPNLLEQVSDRKITVLEVGFTEFPRKLRSIESREHWRREHPAWRKAAQLREEFGFEYLSFVGKHKLGTVSGGTRNYLFRPIKPDKEFEVNLPSAEDRPLVHLRTIEFSKNKAVIRGAVTSYPKTKWDIEIAFFDEEMKRLDYVFKNYENSGVIKGVSEISKKTIEVDLSNMKNFEKAKFFELSIKQAENRENTENNQKVDEQVTDFKPTAFRKRLNNGVTVEEGVGFGDIIVGDVSCTGEFVKARLGKPDKEVKNTKDWWLNYRKSYGLGFRVNPQENFLIEIRLNKGFKGKLTSGISMASTKEEVFNVYGKPLKEETAKDFDERFDDQVFLRRSGLLGRFKPAKIYYNKHGLLFWFDGDKIEQIVIYRKSSGVPEQVGEEEIEKNLVWGEEVNGLRAAVRFVPEKECYSWGEEIGIRFYIQNVSDKMIPITTPRWRNDLTECMIYDKSGQKKSVDTAIFLGWVAYMSRDLQAGEVMKIESASLAVGRDSAEKRGFSHPIGHRTILEAGKYSTHFELTFRHNMIVYDPDGKKRLPRDGDWEGTLVTGVQMLCVSDSLRAVSEVGVKKNKNVFEELFAIPAKIGAVGRMLTLSEKDLVKGLKFFSEISGGGYPSSLDAKVVLEELKEELAAKEARGEIDYANMSEAEKQKLRGRVLDAFFMSAFYETVKEKDAVYNGGLNVTSNDAEKVLVRWSKSANNYRVIYGDLRAETIAKEKLAQTESGRAAGAVGEVKYITTEASTNKAQIKIDAQIFTIETETDNLNEFLRDKLGIKDISADGRLKSAVHLTESGARKLQEGIGSLGGSVMLSSPSVIIYDGQEAQIELLSEKSYISGYRSNGEPTTKSITIGTGFNIIARLMQNDKIMLNIELDHSWVDEWHESKDSREREISIPIISYSSVKTRVGIDNNQNTIILLAGSSEDNIYLLVKASILSGSKSDSMVRVESTQQSEFEEQLSRKVIVEKLKVLYNHRARAEAELAIAERSLDEVRKSWGFYDLEKSEKLHPVTVRFNRLQSQHDECVLEAKQTEAAIEHLSRRPGSDELERSIKDNIQKRAQLRAKLKGLAEMLNEAKQRNRDLDLARVQYEKREYIRDQKRQARADIDEQLEKLKILHDDPQTVR